MKSVYLLLLFSFFIINIQSCTKNDDSQLKSQDAVKDSAFVNTTQYVFSGTVNDTFRFWQYGVLDFQRGNTNNLIGDNENSKKNLVFWLTSNADYTTRFEITTPIYNVDTDDLFSKVLSIGVKQIGNGNNQFKIKININNADYSTYGDQTNSTFYILKSELSKDEFDRDIVKVWCKCRCQFYDADGKYAFSVDDGYTLSEFMYND